MPHDVIMPALGMAQETGLILAWRKAPGDKVTAGDVLMEVETDKAAMEVEAQADGYLADIRAGEGENVPVGNVVAVIADQPGTDAPKAGNDEAGNGEAEAEEGEPSPAAPAGGKSVIMPALGMAQDTGLIVAWHKAPGDAVAAGDVLLEVETDKSVMEVEAGHDGFIAELRAEAGENVPVGDVIAVITTDRPEAPSRRKAAARQEARQETGQEASPKPQEEAASPAKPEPPRPAAKRAATPRPAEGRILASPKARRLAAERGLDLARLAAEGHPQPYHVADLDRLAALPAPATAPAVPAGAVDRIEARVARHGYDAFRAWLAGESEVDDLAVWAAFATASLRAAMPAETGQLVAEAQQPLRRRSVRYCDPDLCGLAAIEAAQDDPAPALILRDLTGSSVTKVRFGPSCVPAISVSDDENTFEITLDSPAGMLEPVAAITALQEMAARIEEPLRHLL